MRKVDNYILLISTVIIMLFLSEVGFRIAAYQKDLNTLESLKETSDIPHAGEKDQLGRIVRLSKNPRIIYEFISTLMDKHTNPPLHRQDRDY